MFIVLLSLISPKILNKIEFISIKIWHLVMFFFTRLLSKDEKNNDISIVIFVAQYILKYVWQNEVLLSIYLLFVSHSQWILQTRYWQIHHVRMHLTLNWRYPHLGPKPVDTRKNTWQCGEEDQFNDRTKDFRLSVSNHQHVLQKLTNAGDKNQTDHFIRQIFTLPLYAGSLTLSEHNHIYITNSQHC